MTVDGRYGPRSFGGFTEVGQDFGFLAALRAYRQERDVPVHHLPELIALRHGLRAAVMLNFDGPKSRAELETNWRVYCEAHGLHLHLVDTPSDRKVLLTREPALPKRFSPANLADLGRLFGYPACCVRAHARRGRLIAFPFVNGVHGLAAPRGRVSPVVNFFLRETPFHAIKHLPCSHGCSASRKLGRRVLALVEGDDPVLAERIGRLTRGPALYTGVGGLGICFRGEAHGGDFAYSGFCYQDHAEERVARSASASTGSLARLRELLDLLGRGTRFRVEGEELAVFLDGRELGRLRCPQGEAWYPIHFEEPERGFFGRR